MATSSPDLPHSSPGAASPRWAPLESTLPRPLSIGMLAPCPFPTRQGTQVLIRHIANTLARAGHAVHLVTYGYGEYDDEFAFHLHRAARVDAGLRSGPSLKRPAADAALMMTASRVVKTYHCDLLHVHNVEGLGLGALLKLQTSLPVVYHAHNAMGPELPTYFRAHLAQAFASVIGDVIDRTLPRAADAVITFDPDHKALHELYGIPEDRLHVIPPGLDGTEISHPSPEALAEARRQVGEGPWLLYAGNPDRYQNLPLLWQAFARVRAQRPDVKLLVATGYDPAVFDVPLRDAPSTDGIVVQRFTTIEELRALFGISAVGVCPRALWTGVPLKVLNYLAAGLPTVACKAAARHILNDGGGRVVDDDADAFADAILALLTDPPAAARQLAVFERFRIENHLPLYEAVYSHLLQR